MGNDTNQYGAGAEVPFALPFFVAVPSERYGTFVRAFGNLPTVLSQAIPSGKYPLLVCTENKLEHKQHLSVPGTVHRSRTELS